MPERREPIDIHFLGTGAADWPSDYQPAPGEAEAGAVRGRSSVLVDGHILIDFGATVPDAMRHFGVDAGPITDVLLTHSHGDHCDPDTLRHLVAARGDAGLDLWAHPSALAKLDAVGGVRVHPVQAGESFALQWMAATALPANHEVGNETALHYVLQKYETTVLYATDCAWFLKPAWLHLKALELDALIWDATCGETRGDWRIFEHNNLDMIAIMRQTLETQGVLVQRSRIYLTHLSQAMCAPHEELTARWVPQGFTPAYDGMRISVPSDGREGVRTERHE